MTSNSKQKKLFQVSDYLKTAICVPLIRVELEEWRKKKYKGATKTSIDLLNFWFNNDHLLP